MRGLPPAYFMRAGTSGVDKYLSETKEWGGQTMGILDRFRLDGKLALVTGSATGLGAAIAVALAEAGASVACHGNRRPAEETSAAIRALGRESRGFAADLSAAQGAESLYEAVATTMGPP